MTFEQERVLKAGILTMRNLQNEVVGIFQNSFNEAANYDLNL